jgi:hypothetical protein
MFADRPARLRRSSSHSHSDNTHIHLMYPTHNASLLLLIFASFRLLNILTSYDHSKSVMELNEFDRSTIRESRNVNISICLFTPRSPWRTSSRPVGHHPERRPGSLLFRALHPLRLVKCQRPKPRKPTRPSCATKRPRYAPWTAARGQRQQWHGPVRHLSVFGQNQTER